MVETHHRSGSLNYTNTFLPLFMFQTDYSESKRPTLYLVFPCHSGLGNVYLLFLSKATGINIAESTMAMTGQIRYKATH